MNTTELNQVISDEIHKLRSGKVKTERVNSVVRGCATLVAAGRLELAYMKMIGSPFGTLKFFENGQSKVVKTHQPTKQITGKKR